MSHRIVALLLSAVLLVTTVGPGIPVTIATIGMMPLGEIGTPPPADILATPTRSAISPAQKPQFDEDGQDTAIPNPAIVAPLPQ